MAFTQKQLSSLVRMIELQNTLFIAGNVSTAVLSEYEKGILKDAGIDIEALSKYLTPFEQAFYFGRLAATLGPSNSAKVTFPQLTKYFERGQFVPLSKAEQSTLLYLENRCYNYIKKLGAGILTAVSNAALEENQAVRQQYEEIIGDELKRAVVQRDSAKNVALAIQERTGDWNRDLGRIAETEMQNAYEAGKAETFRRISGGKERNLYKHVYPGACRWCVKLFLTEGEGSVPRLFSYDELAANGSNVGRKPEEWLPTIGSLHPYCYDNKTMVLTDKGWKLFENLDKSEKFLSVNLNTGDAEWVSAVKWIAQPYEGKMILRKNKTFSLCTTPNHFHVMRVDGNRNKDKGKLFLIEEREMKGHLSFLRGIPLWKGEYEEIIKIGELEYNIDDFCEFLGYYLSEGSCSAWKSIWRVNISQSKDCRYKIYECCRRLFGDKCSLQKERVEVYIDIKKRPLWEYLHNLGGAGEKKVPEEIKSLPKKQLEIFLDAFFLGDGSAHRETVWMGYKFGSNRWFTSSSERLISDLSEILLKIGKRPSLYSIGKSVYNCDRQHKVYISKKEQVNINECRFQYSSVASIKVDIIDYSGYIYDVELEKNHTLIVMREGKVCVSGNCRCDLRVKRHKDDEWNDRKGMFEPMSYKERKKEEGDIRIEVGDKTYIV